MLGFAVAPFMSAGGQADVFVLACIVAAIFLVLAPFVSLSDEAAFRRLCSLVMFGLGLILLAVAAFTEGIVATLSGPASIICFGLGMIAWGNAILIYCVQRDRSKSLVMLMSALLALMTMTLGPFLIGLPLLRMLTR